MIPIKGRRNPSTKKNKKNTEIILCFKKLSYIWSVETMKRKQQEKKRIKKSKINLVE